MSFPNQNNAHLFYVFWCHRRTGKKNIIQRFPNRPNHEYQIILSPFLDLEPPLERINIWKRVKTSLGKTTHHPNNLKFLYQSDDTTSHFIKRRDDYSMNTEHEGQEIVLEEGTSFLSKLSLIVIRSWRSIQEKIITLKEDLNYK